MLYNVRWNPAALLCLKKAKLPIGSQDGECSDLGSLVVAVVVGEVGEEVVHLQLEAGAVRVVTVVAAHGHPLGRQRGARADLGQVRRHVAVDLELGKLHDVVLLKHALVHTPVLEDELTLKGTSR